MVVAAGGVAVGGGVAGAAAAAAAASPAAPSAPPFPLGGAGTTHGAAFARLCALQFPPEPNAGEPRYASPPPTWVRPRPPFSFVYSASVSHVIQAAVDEAGGGRLGGTTVSTPAGRHLIDPIHDRSGSAPAPCHDGVTGEPAHAAVAVAAALALPRNALGGGVATALDEGGLVVVGVSGWRLGVCVDGPCTVVAAVDTTRAAAVVAAADADGGGAGGGGEEGGTPAAATAAASVEAPPSLVGTPLITHVGEDGVARPVGLMDDELLTLGRAALADPTWFTADPPTVWGRELAATLTLQQDRANPYERWRDPRPALSASWRLGGPVAAAPPPPARHSGDVDWVEAVARVLCTLPGGSVLPATACTVHGTQLRATESGSTPFTATWTVTPPDAAVAAAADLLAAPWAPDAAAAAAATAPAGRGLVQRGAREVNPASPSEGALAGALPQRIALLPVRPVAAGGNGTMTASAVLVGLLALPGARRRAVVRLGALARAYNPTVWESPSGPPAAVTDGDLILAAIVILPELLGALSLALTSPVGVSGTHCAIFVAVYAVGLASLGPVWSAFITERQRAVWSRRAAFATATAVLPPALDRVTNRTGEGLSGTVVVLETTLLLGAAGGHRLGRVLGLSIGLTAVYVVFTTPLLVLAVVRYVRRRVGLRQRARRLEQSGVLGVEVVGRGWWRWNVRRMVGRSHKRRRRRAPPTSDDGGGMDTWAPNDVGGGGGGAFDASASDLDGCGNST